MKFNKKETQMYIFSRLIISFVLLDLFFIFFIGCAHDNGMHNKDYGNEINQIRSEIVELRNEMDKDLACHFTYLGDIFKEQNQLKTSRDIYNLVIKEHPASSCYIVSYVSLAELSETVSEKIDIYKMIISDFPDHQLAKLSRLNLADIYYKGGEYNKALELLKTLLSETGIFYEEAEAMINNIQKDMK